MSEREDIESVRTEKNPDTNKSDSSDKDSQANGKNPPVHSDEKTVKPSLIDRLKRAFSTEDTEYTDEYSDDDFSDDIEITKGSIFGNLFGKSLKAAKTPETEVKSDTDEKKSAENNSDKTNESEDTGTDVNIETDPQAVTEDAKPEPDPDPEEEAEFAMINAILDGESIDDMTFPDEVVSEEENKSEDTAPEVAETKSEDTAPDVTETKSEDTAPDVTETKSEDTVPEVTETKSKDAAPEVTEIKSEDTAPEVTETKSEDTVPEVTETKSEDTAPEVTETKSEDKLPEDTERSSEVGDSFDSIDIIIEEDDIQDLIGDDASDLVFAEFDVDDESGGVDIIEINESADVTPRSENSDETVKAEEKSGNETETSVGDTNKSETEPQADSADEEIAVEEDQPFDESHDNDFDVEKTDNSPEDKKNIPESEDKPTEDKKDIFESGDKPTEDKKNIPESEDKKDISASEDKPTEDKKNIPESGDKPTEDKKDISASEDKPTEDKKDISASEDKPTEDKKNIPESRDKPTDDKKTGKFKEFYSKAKTRLTVMWNTMDDGSVQPAESKAVSLVKENKESVKSEENTEEHEPVPVPDSEPEPILSTDENEDTDRQSYGEELYKDMFGGESELDKYKRQLYGDDYVETKEEKKPQEDSVSSFFDAAGDNDGTPQSKKPITRMTVIRNDAPQQVDRSDRVTIRESLNVIEQDPREAVLTAEDKKQEEKNQQVLEKVKVFEEEYAQRKEQHAQEREERARKNALAYEKKFGAAKHISEIEIHNYAYPDEYESIKVKAGLFSESVKTEYDFYLGYSKLQNVAKRQLRINTDSSEDKKDNTSAGAAANSKAPARADETERTAVYDVNDSVSRELEEIDKQNPDLFEYRNEEEAGRVRQRIHGELKRYKSRFRTEALLTAAVLVLCLFSSKFSVGGGENANGISVRIFAIINFLIYTASVYNVRSIITHGLKSLAKPKANRDTSIALAGIAVWVQSLAAVITPAPFLRQGLTLYSVIIMLIFAVNTYGRYLNAVRINMNFRFVSDSSQKYTGKFFHDQRMLATLLSGMRNEKSELVFQKKTAFLKHFIKLSKMHDPGEELAKKFALPTLAFTVLMTIVYGLLSHDFCETLSFLSIMLCVCVPVCSQILGALPLSKLSREALQNQSMVVGYPAVERFADSGAVMIDAKELYPEGSVHLSMLKTFDDRRKDEAVIAAAAIMIAAGGAASGMFDELIGQRIEMLPKAENVMYQDGKGLIGWVDGERYFIGNRQLILSHGMQPADIEYENEQKQGSREILYLARSGEVIAMFIVTYDANRRVADALRRMEATGMTLLIRTTDANITAERIAADFGVYYKNIKILEQKNANFIRDEMIGKEKASPAFIATKGGVTSFGRAVSECIQAKNNISLSVAIQVFAVLLELLVVSLFGVLARVSIHTMPWVFFSIFWIAATLVGPMIVQKFQK